MTDQRRSPAGVPGPGGALDRFGRAFPGLRVSVADGPQAFALDYRSVGTDRFTINRLRCRGRLRAVGPLPERIAIGRRTAGAVAISRDGVRVDTSGPFLRPIAPAEFEVRDGAVMLVELQPATLAEYLARSGERGIGMRRPQTAPHLVALRLAMRHAAEFLDEPDALTPHAAEELEDLLCWSLLQAFDDPWSETELGRTRSSALRRALRYLEEHADGAVTMPAVAEAARVSVRSLGLLFRTELGTTPTTWLRDLRLDRARRDLLDGAGTVAEVAASRGLPSGGRFAAQYGARFGEHPAATLRGAARPRPPAWKLGLPRLDAVR